MSDSQPIVSPVPTTVSGPVALPITGGTGEEVGPAGYLLLETGDKLILEDGLGFLLLEG